MTSGRTRTSERRISQQSGPLDKTDRAILQCLIENANITYADLGAEVGLSAAAAHERVKRLREAGTIKSVNARIDPQVLGKPLLAFVHVNTARWAKSRELAEIERFPEVEEIHTVAGDTSMIFKVRSQSTKALENLLERIFALDGVTSTCSYIVMSTLLERPVQATTTEELNDP
jgi:DNA-binding Lrp family transcriptional regulator